MFNNGFIKGEVAEKVMTTICKELEYGDEDVFCLPITVAGDSMSPEYPAGSQIFIKKINEKKKCKIS